MGENGPIVQFVMGTKDYSCDSVQLTNLQGELRPPVYRLVSDDSAIETSRDKEYILDLMFALQQARSVRQLPQHIDETVPRFILDEGRPIAGKLP